MLVQKGANLYQCEKCDYKTSRKHSYCRHLQTLKHLELVYCNEKSAAKFICEDCGKKYKHDSSFYRHKKICTDKKDTINTIDVIHKLINDNEELRKTIIETQEKYMEQNKDLTQKVYELSKTTSSETKITNIHNSFNLQIFLNEKCNDALNIMDFVDSLQVKFQDLENVGRIGYVEGISKIFINGIKDLEMTKRPIHCSDLKRETIYVKDDNIWEKDTENKKMKKVIRHIAAKNMKQVIGWLDENPDARDIETKKHEQYMKIINKSAGGLTEEEDEKNYNKIIRKVVPEITIDKNMITL